jgi:hypothetical protein
MANEQLPLGQIQPAARPVSAFIQPGLIQPARPAEPQSLRLTNDSIGLVNTPAKQNVGGYDQGEQFARALAPFSEKLTSLLNYGVQLYASNEYRQGQNEALKAYTLANRQMMASADQYAAENRALERRDPIAAMMMDRANPFRSAGRQNQLSQLAAQDIPLQMQRAYRQNRDELAPLDPADPRINQLKANVLQEGLQRFGLDEFSPGVIDYVVPKVNAQWDKITTQQIDDHNAYIDETAPRIMAATLYSKVAALKAQGYPSPQIVDALRDYLDQEARKFGVTGKGQKYKQQAIQSASAMAVDASGRPDQGMRSLLGAIPIGPPDANGVRQTAGQLLGLELFESNDKYDQIRYRQQQQQQEQLGQALGGAVAEATLGMPDGEGKKAVIDAVLNDPRFAALNPLEKLKAIKEATSVSEDVTNRSYSDDAGSSFLQEADAAYGSDWNPKQWDQLYRLERDKVAPERRAQFDADYAAMRRRKESQKKDLPIGAGVLESAITRQIKANLERYYPDFKTAAMQASQGGRSMASVEALMAAGDANSAESTARQSAALRQSVYEAIDAKRGQLDRELTPAEAQQVISTTLSGFEKNAPSTWKTLFPGANGLPSVVPLRPTRPDPDRPELPKPPPGRRAQASPTYQSAQLDNMPNREQRLSNWRGEAVLSAAETARLVPLALQGQALPAPVTRAAKQAGTSPQQFLLQQVDFYPDDIKLSPAQRSQLSRNGQQARATQNYVEQVRAMNQGSPLAAAGNWFLNTLTGSAPAYAGPGPRFSYTGGKTMASAAGNDFGGLARLVSSGEGGWNSVNYGTTGSAGTLNLVGSSVGQIERLQSQGKVFAVGAYQFTPGVLARARKAAGLAPDAPMSPNNQTAMFWALILKDNKREALRDYLTGKSSDVNRAHLDLAREWAAVQGPSGRGVYDGDAAGNRASIPAARVRQALIKARQAITGGRS